MGIQDRDYYRDQYRKAEATGYRARSASVRRMVAIWVTVGVCIFAAFASFPLLKAPPQREMPSARAEPPPVPALPAPGANRAGAAAPQTPAYDRGNASPAGTPGSASIYRCGNTYGNSRCPGGRTVDSPAASGFDSRPSERLATLVAEGRSADASNTITTTRTVTTVDGRIVGFECLERARSDVVSGGRRRDRRNRSCRTAATARR